MGRLSQRLYDSGQLVVSNGGGDVGLLRLLKGRARQLVHLTGYRFGIAGGGANLADGSRYIAGGFLRAINKDYNDSALVFIFDDTPATPPLERHVIDFKIWAPRHEIVTSGAMLDERAFDTGWVACDLIVPEVNLASIINNDLGASATWRHWGIVEYDWVDASLEDVAARMFAWGRDPQDFDREVG